jgi:hypothetical protein
MCFVFAGIEDCRSPTHYARVGAVVREKDWGQTYRLGFVFRLRLLPIKRAIFSLKYRSKKMVAEIHPIF